VGTLGAVGALVGAVVGVAVGTPPTDGANVGAFDGDDVMPHRGIAAAHIEAQKSVANDAGWFKTHGLRAVPVVTVPVTLPKALSGPVNGVAAVAAVVLTNAELR